ncbi:FACT complex subunit-domain-containing protein [Phlyctochytrium arcticum]|nr:FACT complex subunit-domain-containing protein [Phlyctochytrium arcticum]
MSIVLDASVFHRRIGALIKEWKDSRTTPEWASTDVLALLVGAAEEDAPYQKGSAIQTWLLGYEFTETLVLVTEDKVVFYTSEKKSKYIEPLIKKGTGVTIEIVKRSKDEAANKAAVGELLQAISSSFSGKKIGTFAKDKYQGKLVTEWKDAIKSSGKLEEVDISGGVANVLAVKDDEETRTIRQASKLSCLVMKKYFVTEMMEIIDEGKKVKHEQITQNMEDLLVNEEQRKKYKFPADVQYDLADWCYPPIVQSGGKYDLKVSAQSNTDPLHEGTILCTMGIRYKSYCSNVARTYLMNPEKNKEKNYNFLVELQEHVLQGIKEGVTCAEVYNSATSYIEKKRPDLKSNFLKNCGWSIGIEFRESAYTLSPKHTAKLRSGMILNLVLGFQNLENQGSKDPKNKTYALLISDTIIVTNAHPTVLTEVKKGLEEVSFEFQDEDEGKPVKPEKTTNGEKKTPVAAGLPERKGKRLRDDRDKQENEARRQDHQRLLHSKLQEEGVRRFSEANAGAAGEEKEVFKKFASYKSEAQLPKQVQDLKIVVDTRNESIILPIYGQPVPFHVSTLKNVSKSDEQDYVYLRFNFVTPGQVGKKDNTTPFEDPNATFIRALNFRSSDIGRFAEIFRQINDLKKDTAKREAERKEKAGLVEQDRLVEIRGRRPLRLPEVYVRPQMDKRFPGDLEIHTNGIRYQSQLKSGQSIDILFSNIKHLIFQACDHELVVIIHIHLRDPIMIGKRKTKDVQIYRDVTDAGFDETGGRNRRRNNYGDEDELAMEQEERRRRAALNKEFKNFADKIQDASRIDVDETYRDLGFHGVFSRQLVLLQPTNECLVHLIDMPNLVITLAEVEFVHLERVQFGLKNFDMVFVYKDYSRPVTHITTVPVKQLENVKEWLDSCDIPYSEGPANLSWPQIMKTVNSDPIGFFEAGGWIILQPESDDENSEEEISEFEMDESDFAASSDDSAEFASDGSGSADYSGSESEVESGEDWDELERKAAKADAEKGEPSKRRGDDDDDRRPSKKRR